MPIHRWLDFKITRRCNNHGRKCGYCDVPVDPASAPEILDLPVIQRTLLDARALGFDTFWILGGEPTLREDAEEVLDPVLEDRGAAVTVVTNGREPNWRMFEAVFRGATRRACVQVSLDTLHPENLRHGNPAASEKLVVALRDEARIASRPGRDVGVEVHAVVSRENLDDFDAFVRHFAGLGVPVSLAMVCPWKVVDNPAAFNEFTKEEVLGVAERIGNLRTGMVTDAFNPIVAGFIRRMVMGGTSPRPCGAGLTHLVVNADGSVHRCMAESFMPATVLGNIREERLHGILGRVPGPKTCAESTECFDGFAWDLLAFQEGPPDCGEAA